MDDSSGLSDAFNSPGAPPPRISRYTVMLVLISAVMVWGISTLAMKMISREPSWKIVRQKLAQEEEQRMADWQVYENKEYGFSFEQPPKTKRTDCTTNTVVKECHLNVAFGTENFKEIVAVREADAPSQVFFFGLLVKENFTGDLQVYVTRQRDTLKNIARNANRNDASEYIVKDVTIDGVAGYVIETVTTDTDRPSRRFFIPLGNATILLILEIDSKRPIDDMLATVKINARPSPKPSSVSSSVLRSDFLKNDPTALSIIQAGQPTLFINQPYLIPSGQSSLRLDADLFQYKIFNALRMLGYAHIALTTSQPVVEWANAYSRLHQIPQSQYITAEFLQSLDADINNHEKHIQPLADRYPVNESFEHNGLHITYVPHHVNEPPKDHIRYFMSTLLSQLPPSLAPLSVKSAYEFLKNQGFGMIYLDYGWKLNYMPAAPPLNRPLSGLYKRNMSDAYNASFFMSYYAYQTDSLLYKQYAPTSGMVDTSGFYQQLYDMSSCIRELYCLPKPEATFVTEAAEGAQLSDYPDHRSVTAAYSESFAMYVLQGKLFRKLATLDPVYQSQYLWLKDHAFSGIEYCSGDDQLISSTQPSWNYKTGQPADGVTGIQEVYIRLHSTPDQPVVSITELMNRCPASSY